MFDAPIMRLAQQVVDAAKATGTTITTAESCTGGLIAASLTAIPGASSVFERGVVSYSNAAKTALLKVEPQMLELYGAVSRQVAEAMAKGALQKSHAGLSVAVTGIAGPDGGSPEKPVGLVYLALARRGGHSIHQRMTYGTLSRNAIRHNATRDALLLLSNAIADGN